MWVPLAMKAVRSYLFPRWTIVFMYVYTSVLLLWEVGQVIPATVIHDKFNTILIDGHETGDIKSPGYPDHCHKPLNVTVQLAPSTDDQDAVIYLEMMFDDLDIPPDSILKIYDGADGSSPLFIKQPEYALGHWTRPFIHAKNGAIFMYFHPGASGSGHYVGFKAQFWTNADKPYVEVLKFPMTDCPAIDDPLDSGKVEVHAPSTIRDLANSPDLDCVWQIKLPFVPSKFKVYFRILELRTKTGTFEIREGIHSEAKSLLFKSFKEGEANYLLHTNVTSSEGLYIHLKTPLSSAHLTFTYGVYQDTPAGSNTANCSLQMEGSEHIPGFKCESASWCIPKENECNELSNCPDGSDEVHCAETEVPVPQAAGGSSGTKKKSFTIGSCKDYGVRTCENGDTVNIYDFGNCPEDKVCNLKYGIVMRVCPDGSCVLGLGLTRCPGQCLSTEQQCPDGTCVNCFYGADSLCAGQCSRGQKACPDDTCVNQGYMCPGEACPSYKPLRCPDGYHCYRYGQKCDGSSQCRDGYDEIGCSYLDVDEAEEDYHYVQLGLIICGVVGCCVLFCCIYYCCCKKSSDSDTSPEGSDQSGQHMEPLRAPQQNCAAAGPPSGSSFGNYDSRPAFGKYDPSQGACQLPTEPPPPYEAVLELPSAPCLEQMPLPSYNDAMSTEKPVI